MQEMIGYLLDPDSISEFQPTVLFVVPGTPFPQQMQVQVTQLRDFRGAPINLERLKALEVTDPVLLQEKEGCWVVKVLGRGIEGYSVEGIRSVAMDGTITTWEGNVYSVPFTQYCQGKPFGASYAGLAAFVSNVQPLKQCEMEPGVGVYDGRVVALVAKRVTTVELANRLGKPEVRSGFTVYTAHTVSAF